MLKLFPSLIIALSGMCALIYEVLWMRMFSPIFGLSVYSSTTVVCAFMAGLGLGSYLAIVLLPRWKASYWKLYALLELGIAASVFLVPFSLSSIQVLYVTAAHSEILYLAGLVRFALAFLVMLPPTLLMGLTLPCLLEALQSQDNTRKLSDREIALYYGLNTLGAALGCLLIGLFLLSIFGIFKSVCVTAGLNLFLAITSYLILAERKVVVEKVEGHNIVVPLVTDSGEQGVLSTRLLCLLYFTIGVTSFGYELSWFRILIFYLQSTSYSFALMLALFLLGTALGSLYYTLYFGKTLAGKGGRAKVFALSIVQLLLCVYCACTFHIYRDLSAVWQVLLGYLGASSWAVIFLQKALIAGAIILPPAFLMGLSFPLLAVLYTENGKSAAISVGTLYAANTAGAILGSLATGFFLFNLIGVQASVSAFAFLNFLLAAFLFFRSQQRERFKQIAFSCLSLLYLGIVLATPGRMLISNFERFLGKILFYEESAADITIVFEKDGERTLAFNDGRGTSSTRHVNNYVNRILAYSSFMSQPKAKDVLVISFGCGNTASAYTKFPIRSLDIVDISPGAFRAAAFFATNEGVLDDKRVRTFVEDGRNYLLKSQKQYDIIQLELPTIHTDGVINLYTQEFYHLAYKRLKPGGVLSQWIDARQTEREPSYMLLHTMLDSFPEATVWANKWSWWANGVKGAASSELDYAAIKKLFSDPKVFSDMTKVGTSVNDTLTKLVAGGASLRELVKQDFLIVDDRTVVDHLVPKLSSPSAFGGGIAYYTSPFASLFYDRWKKDGTLQSLKIAMFPFYPSKVHDREVDKSLQKLLKNISEQDLLEILKNNDFKE